MSGTFMLNNRNYTASGNLRLGGDVANPNIADVYDPTQTYNTGDRRIYNDVLYVCNDDNVTGAWDSTKWDSATIDEIISALTADDIPYSSGVSVADKLDNVPTFNTLTSSDNNKLLGVSVSGSDISVDTVDTPFIIDTFSKSYSIGANSIANMGTSFIVVPVGYTIGGIVSYSTNRISVFCSVMQLTNTGDWAIQLKNVDNQAYSGDNFSVTVLFIKSSLL